MSASHTTRPTPNPAERSLLVTVSEDTFASVGGVIPPEGTLYSSSAFKTYFGKDYMKEFSDFVYTGQSGDYGLLFAMGKTVAQGNTPFRTLWKKFGNHRHPPILEALAFLEDDTFPLVTNVISGTQSGMATGPKNYVREIFINEVNEGSRFLLDQGTSPIPIRIARYPVPQPGYVSYSINGVNGSVPESLHDDLEIPSTQTANVTLIGGTSSPSLSRLPGQFFPRTNFKRRRPYVLTVEQELTSGVWYWERVRVFPPKSPRTTVQ